MIEKIKIGDSVSNIDFNKIQEDSFIDIEKELPFPPAVISIGTHNIGQNVYPNIFASEGNFSCIVGASKSRKSFFKSLLVATYIGGDNEYNTGITTHRNTDKIVLDFDTEQSDWHAQRVFKRTPKIINGYYENYKPYALRKLDYKERLEFIEWCIYKKYQDIGLICIDGIADLVSDVNNLQEANDMMQKLMKWSSDTMAHIMVIVHANWGSTKATGHLGSAIQKKAETVCHLKLNDQKTETEIVFTFTRGFPIQPLSFTINNLGLPIIGENNQDIF